MKQSNYFFPFQWWFWCTGINACRYADTHLHLSLSLSERAFYSERLHWSGKLQLWHSFTPPPSLSAKPLSYAITGPSFLASDAETWRSHRAVRMVRCTCRQEDAVTTMEFEFCGTYQFSRVHFQIITMKRREMQNLIPKHQFLISLQGFR